MQSLVILFLILFTASGSDTSAQDNFYEFLNAVYDEYGLPRPWRFAECFNETTSEYFFQWIFRVYDTSMALTKGNYTEYHAAFMRIMQIHENVMYAFECASQTEDFYDFLMVIRFPIHVGEGFFTIAHHLNLFFSADPWEMMRLLGEPLKLIKENKFDEAGRLFANNIYNIPPKITDQLSGVSAWLNGVFLAVGLQGPSKVRDGLLSATRHTKIGYIYDLYYNWGQLVGEVPVEVGFNMTEVYLAGPGKLLYGLVDEKDWELIWNNDDMEKLRNKYGFDVNPYNSKFIKSLKEFSDQNKEHQAKCWSSFGNLAADWNSNAYLEDGVALGKLLDDIVKAKSLPIDK